MIKRKLYKVCFGMSAVITSLILFCPVVSMAAPPEEEPEVIEEPVVVKPTLNAAISEKNLTVQAVSEVGIKAIYINGYKFENSGDGNLKIKLQQYDAGYEIFYIYAEDMNGVASEVYELVNPYYDTDPTDDENPGAELPINAEATDPTNATGVVTEHFIDSGREFYTVQSASGKNYYLIIDLFTDEETVYFLTEVSENDLLNVTENSEKLPRNSAVAEGAVPDNGKVIVNNNAEKSTYETVFGSKDELTVTDLMKVPSEKTGKLSNQTLLYAGLGVVAIFIILVVTLSKKKKKKPSDDADESTETIETK